MTAALAALLGASGVALGALGAHFLKQKMQMGLINSDQLNAFDTASKYQLFHSIIILIIGFSGIKDNLLQKASYLFISGIILFSGSIYILSTKTLIGIENLRWLGPVTPLGGILFITGWIFLFIYFIRKK
jgi:uncharacterized membrane protein YgdD (TMEM256/DUF423 family)